GTPTKSALILQQALTLTDDNVGIAGGHFDGDISSFANRADKPRVAGCLRLGQGELVRDLAEARLGVDAEAGLRRQRKRNGAERALEGVLPLRQTAGKHQRPIRVFRVHDRLLASNVELTET